jgi:putative zinc finger/helix-turn-helix YgiT family protein
MTEVREDYHYLESGLDNVYLTNVCVSKCDCGESFASIPAVIKLNGMIGRSIAKKKSRLNGKEIKFLRKNVGLNANALAEYIGVDKSTVSRWESGKQKIDKSNDRVIRIIYAHLKNLPLEDFNSIIEDFKSIIQRDENLPIYVPIEALISSQQFECSIC